MTLPGTEGGQQDVALVLTIALVSLALSAFFSGAETGFMSVSRVRLRNAGLQKTRRGQWLLKKLRRIDDPILTCLIGTNLFNVLLGAVATAYLSTRFGRNGEWLALVAVSTLVIIFGEILPKVLFREFPERMTLWVVPVISLAMAVLAPVRWLLRGYSFLWQKLLPPGSEDIQNRLDRSNLSALLLTNWVPARNDQRFSEVMDRFLKLAETNLAQTMRPLNDLVTVGSEYTVGECLTLAAQSGFSRLPVTREDGRSLQGYVLVRDLLFLPREDHALKIPGHLKRPFLFVDERLSPYELFEELSSQARQLAVVLDPHGQAVGMIIMEDLIETVVGSIKDEFDLDRLGENFG